MLDTSRFHEDFKGSKPIYAINSSIHDDAAEEGKTWVQNKFCPCCATHHDMLVIDFELLRVLAIMSWEKYLKQNPNGSQAKEGREKLKEYNSKKQTKEIFCPYFSVATTGFDPELYKMLCDDYKKVYKYTGPNRDKYINKVNYIKEILKSHRLKKSTSDKLSSMLPVIVDAVNFINQNREKFFLIKGDQRTQEQKDAEDREFEEAYAEAEEMDAIEEARKERMDAFVKKNLNGTFTNADADYWQQVWDQRQHF